MIQTSIIYNLTIFWCQMFATSVICINFHKYPNCTVFFMCIRFKNTVIAFDMSCHTMHWGLKCFYWQLFNGKNYRAFYQCYDTQIISEYNFRQIFELPNVKRYHKTVDNIAPFVNFNIFHSYVTMYIDPMSIIA